MLNKEEAEKVAEELVKLSIEEKQLKLRIDDCKAKLIEYSEVENLSDTSWAVDNGFIEIKTETKHKLADIPADIKVSTDVCAIDVAEKAFKTKVVLSKEGKKMFKEQYPSIVSLMIPSLKKTLKVTV